MNCFLMPAKFEDMLGQTIEGIDIEELYWDDKAETMTFYMSSGCKYILTHDQCCCEHVRLEEIVGELDDLIDHPLLLAEMISNDSDDDKYKISDYDKEYMLWTFYKLATIKGAVTLRWLGEDNGWYSKEVDFYLDKEPWK